MGQARIERDKARDTAPDSVIKSLANRVIERDRMRDKQRDMGLKAVPGDPFQDMRSGTREAMRQWVAEDWRAFFQERAGILEHDNHLPRPEAERVAYVTTLAKWMDAHRPPTARLDVCGHCQSDRPGAVMLACLSGSGGRYGVHDKCLPDLLEDMRQRGIAALAGYGLGSGPMPANGALGSGLEKNLGTDLGSLVSLLCEL